MSIFAVLLAVAFSAFTTGKKPVNINKDEDPRYWYFYNPSTNDLEGQIGDDVVMHADAVTATTCDDLPAATVECARGYDEEQDPFDTNAEEGQDSVKKIPL